MRGSGRKVARTHVGYRAKGEDTLLIDPAAPEPEALRGDTPDDLLSRVGEGDLTAFEELFDRTHARILGLATRVVGSRAEGEDVVQETFVEVWRHAPRFRADRGSAMAWISTIAHRRAVDHVRSTVSARERERRQAEQQQREHGFVASLEDDDDLPDIAGCLDGLTGVQRESIDLVYFGGLTSREAGERVGVPTATMKTRLRDALQRLRRCMGGAL